MSNYSDDNIYGDVNDQGSEGLKSFQIDITYSDNIEAKDEEEARQIVYNKMVAKKYDLNDFDIEVHKQ